MTLVREVTIENYKSVRKVSFELGRVNVLLGANGSGKSNLMEAIAYGSAASRGKLDNEYLVARGIRVVEPGFTRSAFLSGDADSTIRVGIQHGASSLIFSVDPEKQALTSPVSFTLASSSAFEDAIKQAVTQLKNSEQQPETLLRKLEDLLVKDDRFTAVLERLRPPQFVIYVPENSALRIFQSEPQLLPLGVKGEGLFAHLKALGTRNGGQAIPEIAERLSVLDWFERFEVPRDLALGERSLLIRDRYLAPGALFDQRSANEGFLFLLFYLTVFISDQTPGFFAIDNVDAGLNPKLVTRVVRSLAELAGAHDKQVVLTTHNPAVLDGIDLTNDEHRLFVAERAHDGATNIRRVSAPKVIQGVPPVPLSEAFVRGYLGGLPKNF